MIWYSNIKMEDLSALSDIKASVEKLWASMHKNKIEHENEVKMLKLKIQELEELNKDTFLKTIKLRERISELEKYVPSPEEPDTYEVHGDKYRETPLGGSEGVTIKLANGAKQWWVNGKLHRDNDLPAVEWSDGGKEWWKDGGRHRDGGLPAAERANGDKFWYVNGNPHREGGLPAIEWANGKKEWYKNGVKYHPDADK